MQFREKLATVLALCIFCATECSLNTAGGSNTPQKDNAAQREEAVKKEEAAKKEALEAEKKEAEKKIKMEALFEFAKEMAKELKYTTALEAMIEFQNTESRCPPAIAFQGGLYEDLGNFTDAREFLEKAHKMSPKDPIIHQRYAEVLGRCGEVQECLDQFSKLDENCFSTKEDKNKGHLLKNEPPAGPLNLLVIATSDPRDLLQFARYIKDLKAKMNKVFLQAPKPVAAFLGDFLVQNGIVDGLIPANITHDAFDYVIPVRSLPKLIPNSSVEPPYIKLDRKTRKVVYQHHTPTQTSSEMEAPLIELQEAQPQESPKTELLVGITNTIGNIEPAEPFIEYRNKGIPPEHFNKLLNFPGVKVVNVDIANFKGQSAQILAGYLEQLDLVIAADNSVAQLAAAMGKDVWVITSVCRDWRWMSTTSTTDWYPNVELFAQDWPGEWENVFTLIHARLAAKVAGEIPQSRVQSSKSREPNQIDIIAVMERLTDLQTNLELKQFGSDEAKRSLEAEITHLKQKLLGASRCPIDIDGKDANLVGRLKNVKHVANRMVEGIAMIKPSDTDSEGQMAELTKWWANAQQEKQRIFRQLLQCKD